MGKGLRIPGWVVRLGWWVGALVLGVQAVGCTTCQQIFHCNECPTVCMVTTTWKTQVYKTEDSANNGRPLTGLVGRLYLFDKEIKDPLIVTGSLIVELFDEQHPNMNEGKEVPLEKWQIGHDTLAKLATKDPVGMGYTLFLPWETYRPDHTHLKFKVAYTEGNNKTSLYSTATTTIVHGDAPPVKQAGLRQPGTPGTQRPDLPYPYGTLGAPPSTPANPPMQIPPRIVPQSQRKQPDPMQTLPPENMPLPKQLQQPIPPQMPPLSEAPPASSAYPTVAYTRPGQLVTATPYTAPVGLPPTQYAQPMTAPANNRSVTVDLGNDSVSRPPGTLSFGQDSVEPQVPYNAPNRQPMFKGIFADAPRD